MKLDVINRAVDNLYNASGTVGDFKSYENSQDYDKDRVVNLMYGKHSLQLPYQVRKNLTMNNVAELNNFSEDIVVIFETTTKTVRPLTMCHRQSYRALIMRAEQVFTPINKSTPPKTDEVLS